MTSQSIANQSINLSITIWDATYLFHQKSGTHEFQRLTFGMLKKRNFQKPMIICTTNGKIVDLPAPLWKANQSDSDMCSCSTVGSLL